MSHRRGHEQSARGHPGGRVWAWGPGDQGPALLDSINSAVVALLKPPVGRVDAGGAAIADFETLGRLPYRGSEPAPHRTPHFPPDP